MIQITLQMRILLAIDPMDFRKKLALSVVKAKNQISALTPIFLNGKKYRQVEAEYEELIQ